MSSLSSLFYKTVPLTRIKLSIARLLYKVLRLWNRSDQKTVVRNGLKYELDLREGIDLSLYLFGSFQKHVTRSRLFSLPPDAVILDVGANIGVIALNYALSAPGGTVYAFEPTHYAVAKLKRNIALNPELSKRITVIQSFVSRVPTAQGGLTAYSSWRIDGATDAGKHPVHGGTAQSAEAVPTVSIDSFCEQKAIERVDLIKIDTDGYEFDVLSGAVRTLERCKPVVIFEAGAYLLKERGVDFKEVLALFASLGYELSDSGSGAAINGGNYAEKIPAWGTIDILARSRRATEGIA